jgi:hypothetical protein
MSSFEELNARLAVFEQNVTRDFRGVASDVGDLKERIRRLEEGGAGGGVGGERKPKKSLIHVKMITPKELNSPDGWKRWKADVEDYCEEMFEGMKDILDKVRKSEDAVTYEAFAATEEEWWSKAEQLYRFLRRFTEGEARRVVQSVREDNGFEAWRKLHQQYEPSLVMREAQAMAQFTSMVNRRAKGPAETRTLMLELEERAKRVEELTGETVDDRHMMSVIMGILDQDTLKHTVQYQGTKADRNLGMFKQKIMEFVNLTVPAKSDPMDIGRFEEKEDAEMYDEEL